jgi:serine protease Do
VKRAFPAFLLPSLAVIACAGAPAPPVNMPTLSEASAKGIASSLDSGSYLQALQAISFLREERPDVVATSELDSFEARAVTALKDSFEKAVGEKRFADAIRLFQSAMSLGKPDLVSGWTEKSLSNALASSLDASGDREGSLILKVHSLSMDPTGEELSSALSYAMELGNITALREIAARMSGLGIPVPEEAKARLDAPVDFSNAVKGTVTVWVDRGLKMENGLGTPDRVIGSGFFMDPRGYLLTNYHVIKSEVDPTYEGYSRLFVELSAEKGVKIPAKVVGYDTALDIALLKTEITPEFVFSGVSSASGGFGDGIYAIGSPVGLEKTITKGIISNAGRRFIFFPIGDVLQVDVPLNPGNSGGPLLNEKGDVIGVVFAGLEEYEGLNFAIPYYRVQKIIPQLYKGGEVAHAWLGLALMETDKGLEVIYTLPGYPAQAAGIEEGDILEGVNGVAYTGLKDIQEALLDYSAPSLVKIQFSRSGERHEGLVCLAARPEEPIETALKIDILERVMYPLFGMQLQSMGSYFWKRQYRVLRVVQGSSADESGISENDELLIQNWQVDEEKKIGFLQIYVKKRKLGYLESVIQIGAYLETNNFI